MKLTFLGTGTGIPQARAQSGLIMEVEVGGKKKPLLFDCGCGILQRIYESGYDHRDIDTIFLTHLHLDHVSDLLGLIKANWLVGLTQAHIYGPVGTAGWFYKLMELYPYLRDRLQVKITELTGGDVVNVADCTIHTAHGRHSVTTIGYRVEHAGRIAVYTGDTEPCHSLTELAQGAHVLVYECSFPLGFEVDNHTTPDMLTAHISKHPLNVDRLYLTHLYPHMQGHEQEAIDHIHTVFPKEVHIAEDLMQVDV
ncbi:MAG: MBL fold metallo-hydrolase [Methanomethylovorans sp.]|uniref:MBL fold metallo-hydrolase n=1 Tax=Methanomethylovorans sp. TaxID=2758717 RepID=UPI003530ECEF